MSRVESAYPIPKGQVTRRKLTESQLFKRQTITVSSTIKEKRRRLVCGVIKGGCYIELFVDGESFMQTSCLEVDHRSLRDLAEDAVGKSMLVWRTVKDERVVFPDDNVQEDIYAEY